MEVSLKIALPGHHHPIYGLEISPSDHTVYTAGGDKGIVAWNTSPWGFHQVLYPLKHTVYVLKYFKRFHALIAGDRSGVLHVIPIEGYSEGSAKTVQLSHHPIFDVAISPDQAYVFVSDEAGYIHVLDPETWVVLKKIQISQGPVRCMTVHPDPTQTVLAAGSKEGAIILLDYLSGDFLQKIQAHDGLITALTFDREGQYLFSAGKDAKLKVFNWKTSQIVKEWVPHLYAVYKIEFHPSGLYFATSSRDKDVKIWSVDDMKLIKSISVQRKMPAHTLSVNNVLWSIDGRELISVGDDKMVLVWQVQLEH